MTAAPRPPASPAARSPPSPRPAASQAADMRPQMTAFRAKLSACERHYDSSRLLGVLRVFKSTPAARRHGPIGSLAELRGLVSHETAQGETGLGGPGTGDATGGATGGATRGITGMKAALRYLNWVLNFVDYQRELHAIYVSKVWLPLNSYFTDRGHTSPFPVGSTTFRPHGPTHGSTLLDSGGVSEDNSNMDDDDGRDCVASPTADKDTLVGALVTLRKEYKDIDDLYETREINEVRLKLGDHLQEWENILDEEYRYGDRSNATKAADVDGFRDQSNVSSDLANLVEHLTVIIDKAVMAVQLAERWLDSYDGKSITLIDKITTLKNVHLKIAEKVKQLDQEISVNETQLHRENDSLARLLREDSRTDELQAKLSEVDHHLNAMHDVLKKAYEKRADLIHQLMEPHLTQSNSLKLTYEENRLKRFVLEREIRLYQYKRSLLDNDLQLHYEVKPDMIRFANTAIDRKEALSELLEKKRRWKLLAENALLPLRDERLKMQQEFLNSAFDDGPPCE